MRYAYKNELITLYSLFEFSKNLQLKLVIPPEADWNVKDAMIIFNQTIDSVGFVLSSLPESPIDSGYKSFSPSLVASQGRIMIDHYLSIAYLFSAKDKEMHEFQELVWNQGIDFKRWYLVSNYNPDNPELQNMRDNLEKNEIKIRNHSFFSKLTKNMQNNCAKGYKDKIFERNNIIGKIKIIPSIFWSIDNYFSQYVHSSAYSTDQLAIWGRDVNESYRLLKTFISNIIGLFSLIILEICITSNFSTKQIPLGIFDTLIFWSEFFEGKKS